MAGGSQAVGQASGKAGDEGASLVLYGYPECPFCRRVLAAIESLGLEIPLRDTMRDDEANGALLDATGRETVPVLRIERRDGSVRWMPESLDIVRYLNERFGSAAKA
jgi:glutaredoxin 2